MASPRQDRRTKGKDFWGHPGVTFPTADADTPTIVDTETASINSTLPGFGTKHPDTVNYPNAYLIGIDSSPGENATTNLTTRFVTIPGTLLTGTGTSQFGPVTTTKRVVLASETAPNGTIVADASVVPIDAIESELTQTVYDSLPGPWLYGYPIDPDTKISTRVAKRLVANGTQGGGVIDPTFSVSITDASIANPTIITVASPILDLVGGTTFPIRTGDIINIFGDSNATPSINGQHLVTVIDSTHFSIPVNVTAVAGSGFGFAALAAPIFVEIQELNDRQAIQIFSQIDSFSLIGAARTWTESIDYPWKEVIVGLDYFADTGADSSGLAGSWPIPTQLTYQFGANFDAQVAIRTARHTGKTDVSITRTYSIGPPPLDAVIKIGTSSGEIIMQGQSNATHVAISIGTSTTGTQTSLSQSFHYKTARIEDVMTNGFVTGSLGTGVTLQMDASTPASFTPSATFIGDCSINPGRLGLYVRDTTTITVPSTWPY